MTVLAVITDYPNHNRFVLALDADELARAREVWRQSDRILVGLQHHALFAGRRHWGDLDPVHWRVMILRNLTLAGELDATARRDLSNPVMRSLRFLLAGLVHRLQQAGEMVIEMMRLNRLTDREVAYEFTTSLPPLVTAATPPSPVRMLFDNEPKAPK